MGRVKGPGTAKKSLFRIIFLSKKERMYDEQV